MDRPDEQNRFPIGEIGAIGGQVGRRVPVSSEMGAAVDALGVSARARKPAPEGGRAPRASPDRVTFRRAAAEEAETRGQFTAGLGGVGEAGIRARCSRNAAVMLSTL